MPETHSADPPYEWQLSYILIGTRDIMRLSAFLLVAASSAAFAQGGQPAQTQADGPILTLEEAVQLAVRNNPTHLQSVSQRSRAGS